MKIWPQYMANAALSASRICKITEPRDEQYRACDRRPHYKGEYLPFFHMWCVCEVGHLKRLQLILGAKCRREYAGSDVASTDSLELE